jgi:hypothetical protein
LNKSVPEFARRAFAADGGKEYKLSKEGAVWFAMMV